MRGALRRARPRHGHRQRRRPRDQVARGGHFHPIMIPCTYPARYTTLTKGRHPYVFEAICIRAGAEGIRINFVPNVSGGPMAACCLVSGGRDREFGEVGEGGRFLNPRLAISRARAPRRPGMFSDHASTTLYIGNRRCQFFLVHSCHILPFCRLIGCVVNGMCPKAD